MKTYTADEVREIAGDLLFGSEEKDVDGPAHDALQAFAASLEQARNHRCTLCGYRWTGDAGAEHCGDCHRAWHDAKTRSGATP